MEPNIGRESRYDHLSDVEIHNKILNREKTVQFLLNEAEANPGGLGDVQAELNSLYQEIDNLSAILRTRQISQIVPESAEQVKPGSIWNRVFENAAPKPVSVSKNLGDSVYLFRTLTGKHLMLKFDVNVATVKQVKECLAEELKCPVEDVRIICMGEQMKDNAFFKESNLREGAAHIVLKRPQNDGGE